MSTSKIDIYYSKNYSKTRRFYNPYTPTENIDKEAEEKDKNVASFIEILTFAGFNFIDTNEIENLDYTKNYFQVDPNHEFENKEYFFIYRGEEKEIKELEEKLKQKDIYIKSVSKTVKNIIKTEVNIKHPWYNEVFWVLQKYHPNLTEREIIEKFGINFKGSKQYYEHNVPTSNFYDNTILATYKGPEYKTEYLEGNYTLTLDIYNWDMIKYAGVLKEIFGKRK
jgi:hypothetical protein